MMVVMHFVTCSECVSLQHKYGIFLGCVISVYFGFLSRYYFDVIWSNKYTLLLTQYMTSHNVHHASFLQAQSYLLINIKISFFSSQYLILPVSHPLNLSSYPLDQHILNVGLVQILLAYISCGFLCSVAHKISETFEVMFLCGMDVI